MLKATLVRRLSAPVLKYLECRGQLLGIEGREALQYLIVVAAWLALGGASLFAGWFLLATSLVGVLTHYLEGSWVKATAITGVALMLIATTAGLAIWKRLNMAHWFADSLNELKKDRAWLTTQTTKN